LRWFLGCNCFLILIYKCFHQFNGTRTKPRLSVFCSTKQLYAMLVDDQSKKCLFYGSTLQKPLSGDLPRSTIVSILSWLENSRGGKSCWYFMVKKYIFIDIYCWFRNTSNTMCLSIGILPLRLSVFIASDYCFAGSCWMSWRRAY